MWGKKSKACIFLRKLILSSLFFLVSFAFHAPLLGMMWGKKSDDLRLAQARTEDERESIRQQIEHEHAVAAFEQALIKRDREGKKPRSAFMQFLCDGFGIDQIRAHWVHNAELIKAEKGKTD